MLLMTIDLMYPSQICYACYSWLVLGQVQYWLKISSKWIYCDFTSIIWLRDKFFMYPFRIFSNLLCMLLMTSSRTSWGMAGKKIKMSDLLRFFTSINWPRWRVKFTNGGGLLSSVLLFNVFLQNLYHIHFSIGWDEFERFGQKLGHGGQNGW